MSIRTFDFDHAPDRQNTRSVKWDLRNLLFKREDAIPLWVADMDFAAPPAVAEALAERAAHPVYGYTFHGESYFAALASWLSRRHNWTINPNWCLHSPAVVSSLTLIIKALTRPGDKVLLQSPVYAPFFSSITNNGCVPVVNRLRNSNGFYSMDFESLERDLDGVSLAILCSPHNPVGRVWSAHELQSFADLCLARGVRILSDEIHSDLIFSGHKHIPLASLGPTYSQEVITCLSPSKTFNLAGLSASAIVIENDMLRNNIKEEIEKSGLNVINTFGTTAFEAAYTQGEAWLDSLLIYLQGNRDYVAQEMGRLLPQVTHHAPEGTYLSWFDFHNNNSADLKRFLIHEAGLALESGAKFGPGGEGHVRLNFACPRATLERAMAQLEAALRHRNPTGA